MAKRPATFINILYFLWEKKMHGIDTTNTKIMIMQPGKIILDSTQSELIAVSIKYNSCMTVEKDGKFSTIFDFSANKTFSIGKDVADPKELINEFFDEGLVVFGPKVEPIAP